MTPAPVIRLHPEDGVLIARSSLLPGVEVAKGVTTTERIPAGHKVAIRSIALGEPIRGQPLLSGRNVSLSCRPVAKDLSLTREQKRNNVPPMFLVRTGEIRMLKMFVEEAAALASLVLFIGMIAVWAQVIPQL